MTDESHRSHHKPHHSSPTPDPIPGLARNPKHHRPQSRACPPIPIHHPSQPQSRVCPLIPLSTPSSIPGLSPIRHLTEYRFAEYEYRCAEYEYDFASVRVRPHPPFFRDCPCHSVATTRAPTLCDFAPLRETPARQTSVPLRLREPPARANPVHPTARASITITSTASLSTSTTPSATATNPNTDRKRTKAASCDNSRDPTYT